MSPAKSSFLMLKINNKEKINKARLFALIASSIVIFIFIFSPGLNVLYHSADDFRYALGGYNKACSTDDGFYFVLTLGRPIQAYMDCLNYKFGYSLQHMAVLRYVSAILIGCSVGFFAEWLCCLGLTIVTAFFAAGSLFLIPQLYCAAIIMGASSVISPLLLVLIAYVCLQTNRIYLAVILILCALLTYPAMTFFFVTLILSKVVLTPLANWPQIRREIQVEVTIFCACCLVYFIYAFFNMYFFSQAPVPDAYRLDHPNFNPIEMLKRVSILVNIFNKFWTFLPSGSMILQGWITLVLLMCGSIIAFVRYVRSAFYRANKKIALIYLMQVLICTVALFILSSAFILIIPQFAFILDTGERWLLFGLLAAGWVLIIWSVKQCSMILPTDWRKYALSLVMGLFFLVQGYQANLYMLAKAVGFNQYIHYFQNIFSSYIKDNKQIRRIHFIVPRSEYPYDSFFSANAALMQVLGHGNYELQWCSLARGVPGEEKDHQKEALTCINKLPKNGIGVTYSYPNESYQKSPHTILVDIQKSNSRSDYYFQSLKQYFGIEGWPMF